LLAAADRAGEVRLWEAQGGGLVETLRGHQGAVHALVWNRRGDRLFTAGADGTVRAFDPHSGKQLWQQAAHSGQALAIAIGPDQRIASAGSDGRIAVFDAAGKALGKSPAAGEWLYAVAFGDDGALHAGDWQGRVHGWKVGSKAKGMDVVMPLAPRP
jgi:WD40 repeat protein